MCLKSGPTRRTVSFLTRFACSTLTHFAFEVHILRGVLAKEKQEKYNSALVSQKRSISKKNCVSAVVSSKLWFVKRDLEKTFKKETIIATSGVCNVSAQATGSSTMHLKSRMMTAGTSL